MNFPIPLALLLLLCTGQTQSTTFLEEIAATLQKTKLPALFKSDSVLCQCDDDNFKGLLAAGDGTSHALRSVTLRLLPEQFGKPKCALKRSSIPCAAAEQTKDKPAIGSNEDVFSRLAGAPEMKEFVEGSCGISSPTQDVIGADIIKGLKGAAVLNFFAEANGNNARKVPSAKCVCKNGIFEHLLGQGLTGNAAKRGVDSIASALVQRGKMTGWEPKEPPKKGILVTKTQFSAAGKACVTIIMDGICCENVPTVSIIEFTEANNVIEDRGSLISKERLEANRCHLKYYVNK